MKPVRIAAALLLFVSATALAEPAREATIKQLMDVVHSRQLIEGVRNQFTSVMDNAVKQELAGRTPSPREQQAIDRMKQRALAVMDDAVSWEKFEPMNIRLYQQTFSEEEMQGMLAFYKTPAGQAVVNKMPALMQNLMGELQRMMADMNPKMQQIAADFAAEMKAAEKEVPARPGPARKAPAKE